VNLNKIKILKWLSGSLTVLFIVLVIVPILLERGLNSDTSYNGLGAWFIATDEEGKKHNIAVFWASVSDFETQYFNYGYEAPKGKDLSQWRKKIEGKKIEGWDFSDRGYLYTGECISGSGLMKQGKLWDTNIPLRKKDQVEMILPGAPWDFKTPNFSIIGKFPEYKVNYESDNFRVDVVFHPSVPRWYQLNNGDPFKCGDFGHASLNELFVNLEGTIQHKADNKIFKVKGTGLLENSIGNPSWNWLDHRHHDWMEVRFPNGWQGAVMTMEDDWQWGYHPTQVGWIYDPEKKVFHNFNRVEQVERQMGWDEVHKVEYVLRSRWRCMSNEGILEFESKNNTTQILSIKIPYTPFELQYSYGQNTQNGYFLRKDGTTVELKNGYGLHEDFPPLIPDYRYIFPCFAALLIISWGATAMAIRSRDKKPIRPVAVWMGVCFLAVIYLYWWWLPISLWRT
jgi:hypothetical protein